MKISVIIPCYNAERFVEKCVENILIQTYKNIEIILVDDCSKDMTRELICKLEKNHPTVIKKVLSDVNNGPGGAKNEGLKIASGDYITFVDCDDYLDVDHIAKIVDILKKNKNVDIVLSGFKKVDINGDILYTRTYKNSNYALWQSFASWSRFYRKEWLNKLNLELPYGKVFEDILFQAALMLCNPKCILSDSVGYNYVYNNTSISHTTLCKFVDGALKKEQNYLIDLKKFVKTDEQEKILAYFAYRTMCWHLLKSGCNVGKDAMIKEYIDAFDFLKKEFPIFNKNNLIYKAKDRLVIKMALIFICLLYNLRLSKLFFSIYGRINLEKIWPNM